MGLSGSRRARALLGRAVAASSLAFSAGRAGTFLIELSRAFARGFVAVNLGLFGVHEDITVGLR